MRYSVYYYTGIVDSPARVGPFPANPPLAMRTITTLLIANLALLSATNGQHLSENIFKHPDDAPVTARFKSPMDLRLSSKIVSAPCIRENGNPPSVGRRLRTVHRAIERDHVFIGNRREQLQKEPAQVPTCRNRAR